MEYLHNIDDLHDFARNICEILFRSDENGILRKPHDSI